MPCALWQSSQATSPWSACELTSFMGRTGPPAVVAGTPLGAAWQRAQASVVGGCAFASDTAKLWHERQVSAPVVPGWCRRCSLWQAKQGFSAGVSVCVVAAWHDRQVTSLALRCWRWPCVAATRSHSAGFDAWHAAQVGASTLPCAVGCAGRVTADCQSRPRPVASRVVWHSWHATPWCAPACHSPPAAWGWWQAAAQNAGSCSTRLVSLKPKTAKSTKSTSAASGRR